MHFLFLITATIVIKCSTNAYIKENIVYNESDSEHEIYIKQKEIPETKKLRHKEIVINNSEKPDTHNRHFSSDAIVAKKAEISSNEEVEDIKEWIVVPLTSTTVEEDVSGSGSEDDEDRYYIQDYDTFSDDEDFSGFVSSISHLWVDYYGQSGSGSGDNNQLLADQIEKSDVIVDNGSGSGDGFYILHKEIDILKREELIIEDRVGFGDEVINGYIDGESGSGSGSGKDYYYETDIKFKEDVSRDDDKLYLHLEAYNVTVYKNEDDEDENEDYTEVNNDDNEGDSDNENAYWLENDKNEDWLDKNLENWIEYDKNQDTDYEYSEHASRINKDKNRDYTEVDDEDYENYTPNNNEDEY